MKIQNIISALKSDAAFIWSIENNDPINMQMVLRAYGYDHDFPFAECIIRAAS